MTQPEGSRSAELKELVMRFAPAAAALSMVLSITASVSVARDRTADELALALQAEGRAALTKGNTNAAIDAFESALAVDPGYTVILIDLAEAARQVGLQGKAIGYYREALGREPRNFLAISGEGEALVEKGAVEKARRNLAQLESMCGANCPETVALRARISSGPKPRFAAETGEGVTASN
jgi:tetratricopeptide (TPR) repeat protein